MRPVASAATGRASRGASRFSINSFYGNLGYSRAFFNDFGAAADVTLRGQEIIKTVVRTLEEHGATPIEVDTDGVYFVPPPSVAPEERCGRALPESASPRRSRPGSSSHTMARTWAWSR